MQGWHLLGWAGAALDASAGDVQVNAIPEQVFLISNNNFRMPKNYQIQWAYAGSVGAVRARFNTPRFRNPAFPQIMPVNAVLVVPTDYRWMDMRDAPMDVLYSEELRVDGTNAAANTFLAFAAVTDEPLDRTPISGDSRWARFQSTVTGGTLTWGARAEIVFQDVLDQGTYGVYGLQVSGTTVTAARLIFNNQVHRPGSIGFATPDLNARSPVYGGMGLWGTFQNLTPPGIELLQSTGSSITLEGRMLIKKLSAL